MSESAIALPEAFNGQSMPVYNPYLGWDTTWQPAETAQTCINAADYLDLAKRAATPLKEKIAHFLARQSLTVMRVSQPEFQAEYERAEPNAKGLRLTFDEWVEKKRVEQGCPFYPDVIWVEPCVKTLERSDGKAIFDNPNIHANKDYLRSMLIFTAGTSPGQRRANLERMGDVKASLIEDTVFGTTSRKDQLARPHERTRYRGLHTTTTCTVNDGSEWDGVSITAELKSEHGATQDVLRMTRELQEVRRAMQHNLTDIQMTAGHFHYVRMKDNIKVLGDLCGYLHDFVCTKAGLNTFLTPPPPGKKAINYEPIPVRDLAQAMRVASGVSMRVNNILAVNPLSIPGLQQPACQVTTLTY